MRASRNQLIVLGVLAVIALFMLPRLFFGGSSAGTPTSTSTDAAAAVKPTPNANRAGRRIAQVRKPLLTPTLDPALRHDLLAMGETYEYDRSKCNIFSGQCGEVVKIPPPVDPGYHPGPQQPIDHGPPPPPPIPLKFYGFAAQSGQAKKVFLSSGDDVFVGTEGQVINKRYRIVKINPTSVTIEDILNNNTQPIPLTAPTT